MRNELSGGLIKDSPTPLCITWILTKLEALLDAFHKSEQNEFGSWHYKLGILFWWTVEEPLLHSRVSIWYSYWWEFDKLQLRRKIAAAQLFKHGAQPGEFWLTRDYQFVVAVRVFLVFSKSRWLRLSGVAASKLWGQQRHMLGMHNSAESARIYALVS